MQGLWSEIVIIRAEGGIHGNPVSDHQQRYCHADKINGILTSPKVTRIGAGGGLVVREGKAFNVAEEVDVLQPSKQVNAKQPQGASNQANPGDDQTISDSLYLITLTY